MKIWLSKGSHVPIQEQLKAQLVLGIVSGDLAAGERLPSTTHLSRRFQIHPNTVRAAYRELVDRAWLEWRQGSGFYVKALDTESELNPQIDLDRLIATFIKAARDRGYSLHAVQLGLARWFSVQPPDHVLVVEPDVELRAILMSEIKDAASIRVEGVGLEERPHSSIFAGAMCVALYDHTEALQRMLPPETARLFLHSCSIPKRLSGERRPAPEDVITIVSRWPDFLRWARTTLVAVGIDPEALDLRDARTDRWRRGLTASSFIITDSLMARSLPRGCHPRIVQIIAQESIAELNSSLPTQSE
jgi:DNA-binding transcriptional regulator YhcF (GntR family)